MKIIQITIIINYRRLAMHMPKRTECLWCQVLINYDKNYSLIT